jgi:hypothetical protein
MMRSLTSALVWFVVACGNATPPPSDPGTGSGSDVETNPDDVHCTEPRPSADATCVQDCGPPVVRDDDPPPAWRWLSPDEVAARAAGGCPRCLPAGTRIATPRGDVSVEQLGVGDVVWSQDARGVRIAAPIARVGSLPTPRAHVLVVAELSDGRRVTASPGHPTADARALGTLAAGDALDGAVVLRVERRPYGDQRTFDLLPASPSGAYWADGVLLGSTLAPTAR